MKYLIGEKIGRIEVISEPIQINKRWFQKIRCACGNEKYMRTENLANVKSCGCMNKNPYGLSSDEYAKLYNVWRNMHSRCYDVNSDRYYAYGARGIKVCEEWKDFHSFAKWCIDKGWNSKLSIERKNYDRNYCPDNCTFISMKEQARNKTNNVMITLNGETRCVAEWGEKLGIDPKTIYKRIADGHKNPSIILYKGDLRGLRRCSADGKRKFMGL